MSRNKPVRQITVKLNPEDVVSIDFFHRIENRDRELYPTIFSYLNAAVEMLEVSVSGDRDFPILTQMDLQQIELKVLEARDKEIINQFTRKNLTFAKGAELLHMVRSTIYKMQRKALIRLTEIYNSEN